jgi:3-phosphoshikimate 1-carboxyvinyltransferase
VIDGTQPQSGTFVEYLDIGPLARAGGSIKLPGSKSISNRTLLLAALSKGSTEICDLLASDDVERMLDSLGRLGIEVEAHSERNACTVHGNGDFPVKQADLFLGNAGTAFRPLTAALALQAAHYKLSGVPRMHERPIGDLVDALRSLGARIDYLGQEGFPPLHLRGGDIVANGPVRVRGDVSSQFLTALLMALPMTGRETVIEVDGELISKPYVEITLNLMARFGVTVVRDSWSRFVIPAGSRYRNPEVVNVEGDASGASYFLAAGAIGGGPVRVEGVDRESIQGDVRFADALEALGARIDMGRSTGSRPALRGPAGSRFRSRSEPHPRCGDDARRRSIVLRRTEHAAQYRELARKGNRSARRDGSRAAQGRGVVEEGGRLPPRDAARRTATGRLIDTYDDHRMAMCLSLAALGGVPLRIDDPGCVAKTFPDFFERFAAGDDRARRAGHRDRWPGGVGQGHGRRTRRARAGLPDARQRGDVPPRRAGGHAGGRLRSTTNLPSPPSRRGCSWSSPGSASCWTATT